MFPFPEDCQRRVRHHQSVGLCACGRSGVCNSSHESLFPSSEPRGVHYITQNTVGQLDTHRQGGTLCYFLQMKGDSICVCTQNCLHLFYTV